MPGRYNLSARALRMKMERACLFLFCIVFLGLSTAHAAEFSLIVEPEGHQAVVQTQKAEGEGHFRSAVRWRRVDLLKQLALPDGIAKGDELVLNLFPDTSYQATVDRVSVNVQGTITVRGRLRDYPLGYVLISTTGDASLASIRVPELRLEYTIVYDPDSRAHYLLDTDPSKADKLEDSPAVIPRPPKPEEQQEINSLQQRIRIDQVARDSTATIDIMVVYTPAARLWAVTNQGSIGNVIAQAMEKGQLVADNSGTHFTVQLVHAAEVAYTESGDSEIDLDRLQKSGDGYLDAVHTMRNTYGADLVVLFTQMEDTGGISYLLTSPSGEPAYAFSITRIQQASWTYTTIHEIGHNMGMGHHKAQTFQAGPGLDSYSAGWRWIGTGGEPFCSVMTYEEGRYFSDGMDHTRVPYFSNPTISYLGVATGNATNGDNARTARETKAVVAAYRQAIGDTATKLYFPHVETSLPWQTEIAIVNTSPILSVIGTLKAYNDGGQLIETRAVNLSSHGRSEIAVSSGFTDHTNIGYIVFETDSAAVQGYMKFYQEGKYRTAIPAVRAVNASPEIYIPHIASDNRWWTDLILLNTTPATKELNVTFDNGESRRITLNTGEHRAIAIKSLFNSVPQPGIHSAVIGNAAGIIGLELFGSTVGGDQMDGILLTGKTASTVYYPHVANDGWWTGIVAHNPAASAGTMTVTSYDDDGNFLTTELRPIAGKGSYVGTAAELGLPARTAWFKIDSATPLTGFELFGTPDNNQLAAYAGGGGSGARRGVFPKIETNGWTGIVFVNTEAIAASVTLKAYDDTGSPVATKTLTVGDHAKVVDLAEALFSPQDISTAAYITYSSSREVVGFQLNGSSDGTMLDGLPALTATN